MRRFCIDSSYLGTPRHIVGDTGGYVLSDSVPRDTWHLTGEPKSAPTARCLDTLLRLTGRSPARPPERFVTAMAHLVTGSSPPPIPWMNVMPQAEFREFFKKVVQETTDVFSELPFDYYETAWTAASRVLSALRPARIDTRLFDAAVEQYAGGMPGLESFRPKKSGFAHPVTYDRFATRTGRLTVVEGPNILLLKKDLRNFLVSSFEGGSVVSLDFRALEARIVLAEAGRYSDAEDMYGDIASTVFDGRVTRDVVKTAVLAELYGISRSALKNRLGVSDDVVGSFISGIREHFGIEALKSRLKTQIDSTGKVINRFGRPIPVPTGSYHLSVNSYAQSSGVDVAMLGFDDVLRRLGTDGVRPIFVLHDAIILDVRPDRMPDVRACTHADVTSYLNPFPLKFEQLT